MSTVTVYRRDLRLGHKEERGRRTAKPDEPAAEGVLLVES